MTKSEADKIQLAKRIFNDVMGAPKEKQFGFHREGKSRFKWETIYYEYLIVTSSGRSAVLQAVYKPRNHISMIRQYAYVGNRLESMSIRV